MTTPPTPALPLLDELDELRAKATPGPWFAWNRGVGWHLAIEDPIGVDHLPGRPELVPEGMRTDLARGEDAALIVAAVNALPQLTAALRAVLALHTPDGSQNPWCEHDGFSWPCPTTRALDPAGADSGEGR